MAGVCRSSRTGKRHVQKKQCERIDSLASVCAQKIETEILTALRTRATAALGDHGWSIAIDAEAMQGMFFEEPSSWSEIVELLHTLAGTKRWFSTYLEVEKSVKHFQNLRSWILPIRASWTLTSCDTCARASSELMAYSRGCQSFDWC